MTRIGPGGLINVDKTADAARILDAIADFHDHYDTRLELMETATTRPPAKELQDQKLLQEALVNKQIEKVNRRQNS